MSKMLETKVETLLRISLLIDPHFAVSTVCGSSEQNCKCLLPSVWRLLKTR